MSEDQAKAIRDWIRNPAFQAFTGYLANKAAWYAAEAGNKLVEGEDSDKVEAERAAERARVWLGAHSIMVELMDPQYPFEVANLLPKPITTH